MSSLRDCRPWTAEDIDELAVAYFKARAVWLAWTQSRPGERRQEMGIEDIARALGRSMTTVQSMLSKEGMSRPGAALRTCLLCAGDGRRRTFYSTWIGNRICWQCRQSEVMRCA